MPATTFANVAETYMDLIKEFPLRRIKSAAEYAKAVKLVLQLSASSADRGAAEYLDVLVDLVADYKKRAGLKFDTSTVSAAELVLHRIERRKMSVNALARQIGIPQSNLSEMLSGKRGWSKAAIRGLSASLNIRAERFLA
jgi:antitoxin component HigA of HigAB toxin-antitoxin module